MSRQHYSPPRAPLADESWLAPDPADLTPIDDALTDAEWQRICSEPRIGRFTEASLGNLYDTAQSARMRKS
jgi:hypothetical protein